MNSNWTTCCIVTVFLPVLVVFCGTWDHGMEQQSVISMYSSINIVLFVFINLLDDYTMHRVQNILHSLHCIV